MKNNRVKRLGFIGFSLILGLFSFILLSCQWGVRDWTGPDDDADAEEIDAIDAVEADVVVDGEEDVEEDMEDEDVEDDMEVDAGCTSDSQCDDEKECNGLETCGDDGVCVDGEWLEDGTVCADSEGNSGTCQGGVCVSDNCGNGEIDEGEDCDDGNTVSGDGCEIDCTFSCRTIADCDDSEFCTIDSCVPNDNGMVCEYENTTDRCDDEDECTINDTCTGGVCAGEERDCDDDNVCTDDGCDPASGCTYSFNTADCDDGDPCTDPDRCDGAGNCAGEGFVCACTIIDDCAAHEDGDLCNGTYFCDTDGYCKIDPTTIVVCDPSADTDCRKNTCNPTTGLCSMVDEPDGTECSDDNVCTDGDECAGGACQSGAEISCDDRNDCTDDTCDPVSGCLNDPLTGTVCEDGDLCTGPDLCDAGSCTTGPDVDCDDSNDCTTDGCHPAFGCQYTNLTGTICSDGNACTENDQCQDGTCTGDAVNCDDSNDCTADSCHPSTGCDNAPLTGTLCDDGDMCTDPDLCDAGVCNSGPAIVCDDDNVCTSDTCDPALGCRFANLTGTACDDGDPCTDPDLCDDGVCVPGALICECTVDEDCAPYEDGDLCNGTLVCDVGNCVVDPATIITCDTSSDTDCRKNRCEPSTGVCSMQDEPDGTICDDSDACTVNDECSGGICVSSGTLNCDDLNVCTDDSCDPVNGCEYVNNTDPCDDGLFCTLTDTCDGAGNCMGSGDTCDDGFSCTTDSCDEGADTCSNPVDAGFCLIDGTCHAAGAINPANDCLMCDVAQSQTVWSNRASGSSCDDGLFCTLTDTCDGAGNCMGSGDTCDDGFSCTTDSCDEGADTCSNPVDAGFCLIDGTCHAAGAINPANDCLMCDVAQSQTVWSDRAFGSLCDDGLFCTLTDTCDGAGTCAGTGTPCSDGLACTTDTCDEDTDSCSYPVDAGFCLIGGICYANGALNPANDCQECDDSQSQTGWSDSILGTLCDDGQFCTFIDTCNGAGTCSGTGNTCDDGLTCTTDTCDEVSDSCSYPVNAGTCLIGGICYNNGDDNPANDCQECNAVSDQTAWSNKPPASPCASDGIDCTDDFCDGAGNCVGTPNDLNCVPPDLCRPACTSSTTGCVTPPGYLDLICTSPETPPAASDCSIDLDSMTAQLSCLSCASEAGMVLLDYSDFGDDTGGCDQDGWTFMTGGNCRDRATGCTPSGGDKNCCSNWANICVNIFDTYLLQSNDAVCEEEWRMHKDFDTTGISDLTLCFDYGESGATADEALLVYASDGTNSDRIFCLNGEPRPGVNNVLYPTCVSLQTLWPWTADNPNLRIMFLAHSDDDNDILYIDNISLKGWVSTCTPTSQNALTENFEGCDLSAWTVTGSPVCPGTWNCAGDSLQTAASDTWTIERQVDTSNLDGNVVLCFSCGDEGGGFANSIDVDFNAQDGDGWQSAWSQSDANLGADGTCMQICVNLSDMDSDVNRNPDLLLSFTLAAGAAGTYDLDNITLDGAVYCDGAGTVSLSPISEDGGGMYSFTVTDDAGNRVDADIQCSWDTPPTPIEDWDTIVFVP